MFSVARSNVSALLAANARNFSVAPILALQATIVKSRAADSPELKALKESLKKEKTVLAKLQNSIAKAKDQAKAKRAQAAEKKLEAKAYKPPGKLSGLNVYIKEHIKVEGTFSEVSRRWTTLSDSEKKSWTEKAREINAQNLAKFKPRPTSPAPAYARFTQSVWTPAETFAESSKLASAKWRELSDSEKKAFVPTPEEWEAYRKADAAWKEERLKIQAAEKAQA